MALAWCWTRKASALEKGIALFLAVVPELQYRWHKWRLNRTRRRFDVYSGGRADDDHAPARDPTDMLGGTVERGGDERGRGQVDVGLGVRALAHPQRLLEEHVQSGADRAALLPEAQRVAGLAQDLALTDDHRVEAGGDVEEMGDRTVVVVHVEVRDDVLGRLPRVLAQQSRDGLDAAVEAVDLGVDLDPVARGQCGRLEHVLAVRDVADELGDGVGVERDLLEHRDRGGLVGDPDDEDAHAVSTTLVRPGPSGPFIALRCSW